MDAIKRSEKPRFVKAKGKGKQSEDVEKFWENLRQYFSEVDAFELEEESPSKEEAHEQDSRPELFNECIRMPKMEIELSEENLEEVILTKQETISSKLSSPNTVSSSEKLCNFSDDGKSPLSLDMDFSRLSISNEMPILSHEAKTADSFKASVEDFKGGVNTPIYLGNDFHSPRIGRSIIKEVEITDKMTFLNQENPSVNLETQRSGKDEISKEDIVKCEEETVQVESTVPQKLFSSDLVGNKGRRSSWLLDLPGRKSGVQELIKDGKSKIMRECCQEGVLSLKEAIAEFCDFKRITKLGEGTYGEAFLVDSYCVKIVPMGGDIRVNGELQKSEEEMLTEVMLMRTLSKLRDENEENFCDTFIQIVGMKVCEGKYPKELVKAWEEWDDKNGSENDHPKIFTKYQKYCIFVLENGGIDLEKYKLKSFKEAKSILHQITLALAVGEEACGFEHRDLHWGNVLVTKSDSPLLKYKLNGQTVEISSSGVKVSIIDFTLSRVESIDGQVLFFDMSDDPEVFGGPIGDVQFDTYRRMLQLTNGKWMESHFRTNCMWIHYLADILVNKKSKNMSKGQKSKLRSFAKQMLKCPSAMEATQYEFFL